MASYEKSTEPSPKIEAKDMSKVETIGPGDSQEAYNNLSVWTRMGLTLESFERRPPPKDGEQAVLNHCLKPRHLQMIAIGGSIGAGFFVGSGNALYKGGPGALLLDFAIMGIMIFNVVYALGELACMYPVSGGIYTYSVRFIDASWGFAMGWNYVFQWAIVLPLELGVAAITMGYWESLRHISIGVWIALFFTLIVIVNVFGALGFAEEEFWASVLKLCAVVVFMIIALVFVCGGAKSGPYSEFVGAKLWHDPGAFKNGFKGVCSVFVTAAFAFSGTELIGLAAAEAENPVRALPGAIKQVFWRITFFYILGLLFVGLLVSSNDPRLLGSNEDGKTDADASPFVLAAKDGGIPRFADFMNFIILISVISIGNSGVYGGSRTLTALAEQGYAPKCFKYIDKSGRPLYSTIAVILCGLLAFINLSASGAIIFDWLLALSGLAALFNWGSVCVAHIRFRAAWKAQGRTLEEIPFKAIGGVYGSYLGLAMIIMVLVAQFYIAIFPVGSKGVGSAQDWFMAYLALPIVLFFWGACWLFTGRKGFLKLSQIDVDTGRRHIDWDRIRMDKERIANSGFFKRMWHFLM